jgi:hypothetical protein
MAEPENRGSGVSIDDPYRLAATHPTLGVASQKMLISHIYGEQNKDWFDDGRTYHPNKICEQKIRLPSGQIRKVFFDESALDYSIPIPEEFRDAFQRAAAKLPVPDTQLISRFPLIEVSASTAAEAGRIIVTNLKKAEEQGWVRGHGFFFVDDWRHDYELTRGTEKTVMSFDMRPALLADTKLNLMMFSSLQSLEQVDEVVRRMSEPIERIDVIARINQLPRFNLFCVQLKQLPWRRLLLQTSRLGSIVAVVVGVITLLGSHSFVTAVELAAAAFGIVVVWILCQVLRMASMTPAENCAESCKEHLRLKYSDFLRHLYPRQDIVNEYVLYIEGAPRNVARWAAFFDHGMTTAEAMERLEQSFEDWLKRSPY